MELKQTGQIFAVARFIRRKAQASRLILEQGAFIASVAMKGGVLVEYDGAVYHPYAYELKFQPDGKIKHTAILKEQKANCLVYCRLEDIKEK